ncbi:unnamed protein product, partial [Allacma fusca]
NVGASCTIKLSNFLNTALSDLHNAYPQFSVTGPSRVVGNNSEVFSSRGHQYACV